MIGPPLQGPWRAVETLATGNVCHDNDDDCEVTVDAPDVDEMRQRAMRRAYDRAKGVETGPAPTEHEERMTAACQRIWFDSGPIQILFDAETATDYKYVELDADLTPHLAEGWEVTAEPAYPNHVTLQQRRAR